MSSQEWNGDESAIKRLKAVASKATEQGEPLYIVTSERDVENLEVHQGKIAWYFPPWLPNKGKGVRAHQVARAIDGVPEVTVVRCPSEMSIGRLQMLMTALAQVSNLKWGSTLHAVQPLESGPWYATPAPSARKLESWWEDATDAWNNDVEVIELPDIEKNFYNEYSYRSDCYWGVEDLNCEWAVVSLEGKTRVLHETKDPDGHTKVEFFTKDAARDYLADEFHMDEAGVRKPVFKPWWNSPIRRKYMGVTFLPGGENRRLNYYYFMGMRGGPNLHEPTCTYYNLWMGFRRPPDQLAGPNGGRGSYDLFTDHLRQNVCGGNEDHFQWIWAWMCNLVGDLRNRPGTALVLRGRLGTGKTIVGEVLGELFHPNHYVCIEKKKHLVGHFNAHLANKMVVQVEEATWAGDLETANILKSIITAKQSLMELKGIDAFPVANYARLILTGNADWIVPAGLEERRFAVFDVGEGWIQDRVRFGALTAQLEEGGYEALLFDLLRADRTALPDPAVVPDTMGLRKQKLHSLSTVGRWWHGRLSEGLVGLAMGDGWPAEVSCEGVFDHYVDETRRLGRGKPVDRTQFGKQMRDVCPGFRRGREGRGERRTTYVIPPLEECRKALEEKVGGKIDWEDAEPWE